MRTIRRLFTAEWFPIVFTILLVFIFNSIFWIKGAPVYPDTIFWFMLISVVVTGKLLSFARDWVPFLLILFVYEYLRGMIPQVITHVNMENIIQWELTLFGMIPTVLLQSLFFDGTLRWYDYMFVVIYTLHFVVPQIFAYVLWRKSVGRFRFFIISLLVLTYSGFITYYLFPAAPPWYAAREGVLEGVTKIQPLVLKSIFRADWVDTARETSLFQFVGINEVAAIPSLHAAYPTLLLIIGWHFYRWRALLYILPYALVVYVGIVYLGDHYVVDVLLGILYAIGAYVLVYMVVKWLQDRQILSRESIVM